MQVVARVHHGEGVVICPGPVRRGEAAADLCSRGDLPLGFALRCFALLCVALLCFALLLLRRGREDADVCSNVEIDNLQIHRAVLLQR